MRQLVHPKVLTVEDRLAIYIYFNTLPHIKPGKILVVEKP
jgi:hypothetical protein